MVNAEDLPGGLKARSVLKQMEINPPSRSGSRGGVVRRYVESLYPELRSVREKGWSWKAIHAELSKVEALQGIGVSGLAKEFAAVDREWEKKTGVPSMVIRRYKRKRKNGAKEAE